MNRIVTVGLDLAKNVFQVHGAGEHGEIVLQKQLRRKQVLAFFNELPHCQAAREACGGSHFWAREIGRDKVFGRRRMSVSIGLDRP